MLRDYFTASTEAIDTQYNRQLFNSLVPLIEECRDIAQGLKKARGFMTEKLVNKAFHRASASIAKVVNTSLNLKVAVHVDPTESPNAYVQVPVVDRYHPLIVDWYRWVDDNAEGLKLLKKNDGLVLGGIDRGTSRVTGKFSEIRVNVWLTFGLLYSPFFTAEEVVAVLLHEFGHVFTYFEYLGTQITTNFVLHNISRRLLETRELERKYLIIKEGSNALGIPVDRLSDLAYTDNEAVIQTVVIKEVASYQYSELNSKSYDLTAWEMLSDQFSTRHGAGRYLATAMDKLYVGGSAHATLAGYLFTEAFKLLVSIGLAPLTLLVLGGMVLFKVDPNEDIYDRPKHRIERIRRDMIDHIKSPSVSKELLSQYVEDIRVIDQILKEMNDRRTFLELAWSTLGSRSRYQRRQLEFQRELEVLSNNDLFVKSAELSTLNP